MITRRSVWANPKIQELLESFVTVADEVGRLQRGADAECALFQEFCEAGHYGGRVEPSNTRQGIYAIAPSGRFLASCNTRDAGRVERMLRDALERWRSLPADQRRMSAGELERVRSSERFEDRYPADGLVLVEYVRDLDRPVRERDWRTRAWNQDQAWFTAAEAAAFVPEPEVGAESTLPAPIAERIARLHLVDIVRGQTSDFPRRAVRTAAIRSTVRAVEDDRIDLTLRGETECVHDGKWAVTGFGERGEHERGVKTTLVGTATWDRRAERFVAFELAAIGTRWGATQFNQRGDDLEPTRIGFAFVLAPADHPRVAPAFWWDYGWD